jgi:polyhydroxyalkanoate synthesis regulator phasin
MSTQDIRALVDEVIADGKMTNAEKKRLDELMLADGKLSLEEREQIDRLLTMIGRGELLVVDE